MSEREALSTAAWWEPVHACRAESWQFKGLYVFQTLDGVVAGLCLAALGVCALAVVEGILAEGGRY